jgi:hypothetical protein
MRGGSLEEFTRGLFFMDECRVWVFVGGRRKRRKRIYNRDHVPLPGGNCGPGGAGFKDRRYI